MKLYHGTNKDFDKIDLLKSKPNKDFGRGFYLSANYEQALTMAQVKVEQLEIGTPIVQSYYYVFAFLKEELTKGKFE